MKFLLSFLIIFAASFVSAKTMTFRSGKILAAEYNSSRPNIKNWNKYLFPYSTGKKYAAIAVILHPERTISLYDYVIEVQGVKYPAIAIRKNSGNFEFTQKTFKADNGAIYTLLFQINISDGSSDSVQAAFGSTIRENRSTLVYLPLKKSDDNTLLPFKAIKKEGAF